MMKQRGSTETLIRIGSASDPIRIGNTSFRLQYRFIWVLIALICLLLVFFYTKPGAYRSAPYVSPLVLAPNRIDHSVGPFKEKPAHVSSTSHYDATYPLTPPVSSGDATIFQIAIIADLDTSSRKGEAAEWKSYLMRGQLRYDAKAESVSVTWNADDPAELVSNYALKGRGMECSELNVFNGRLYTFDDRTGFVYEIHAGKMIPWVILLDGDGTSTKGFKTEWATVKNETLYVGSMGKEWTTSAGEFQSYDPMWVKTVSPTGEIRHLNWQDNYKAIRRTMQIEWPGYMIHESGAWSPYHRRWFFLPRRCSKDRYNETRDEHQGCNALISADERFEDVKLTTVGELKPTHGFSSFKFIPGSRDQAIVALKTEEVNGKTSTFVMAFTVSGKVLMDELKVPTDLKYEGLEFV